MALYFVTLSLLILAVLGVRAVFRKSVSPRLIYALWIAVALRLCLPVSLFEADFLTILAKQEEIPPVEAIQPTEETVVSETLPETVLPEVEYVLPEGYLPEITLPAPVVTNPVPVLPENNLPSETAEILEEPKPPEDMQDETYRYPLMRTAVLVWIGGAAVIALWFTVTGWIFRCRLRRDRKFSGTIGRTNIYISSSVGAPCLSGLIPEIYITPEVDENPSRELVVLHEYTHLRHLDHLWSFLRIAALCIHWFNPLVWTAAILSKQDAELACDDAICSRLEDKERLEYARVLIETIPQKHRYATGLGSSPMKQRILRLTKRQKNHLLCAFLAAVLMIAAVGCSFAGLRRVTYDNITHQKGFTILSQEQKTVEIHFDMDLLPGYEELCEYSSGVKWYPVDVAAAEEGNSRIVLKSAKNFVTHEPRTDDRVILDFDIEHDFSGDEGTILNVYYIETNDSKTITRVYCWFADDVMTTENGDIPDAVVFGDIVSANGFRVSIPADIYTELSGKVSFRIVMNAMEYARGEEVREYEAEIFTESEFRELLGKNHGEETEEQPVPNSTEVEIQLPPGQLEAAQISYTPIVYEITQEMSVAMLSNDLIVEVLDSITVDGLELFLFKGSEGSTCAGYRKDGIPYKFLTMAYPDGVVTDYSLEPFKDILNHDGFVIEWGGAHVCRYYYTMMSDGTPAIFLPATGNVYETDFDCDGITEVIANETSYSKVYDLFFEEEDWTSGLVSTADLTADADKTGYLCRYDAETGYFVFTYRKNGDDAVYHRYGMAEGSTLTISTPFKDIDMPDKEPDENTEAQSPVEITYKNTDLPVNTVLIPLTGANPRYQTYHYDDRYTIYITCDLVTGSGGEYINADSTIVVVDNEAGKIAAEYEIGDLTQYPDFAYGLNCAYLFRSGLDYREEYSGEVMVTDYAYRIDFTDGTVTISDGTAEFDWYSRGLSAAYSPDGKTAAIASDDSEHHDGGVDIYHADGRVERILDTVHWNGVTVNDINDVIGYNPVAFLDDTHLVYRISGWEWSYGFGIYNIETGENVKSTKNYRVLGVHDGTVYASYENDGRNDYGISKMELWKITPDGGETMLAATHEDVPDGVYKLPMDKYVTFRNGCWVFHETGHIDGWSSSDLPDDRIIGAQIMSADFSEVLLEFDYYFYNDFDGKPAVTDKAITISCPVIYRTAPESAKTVRGDIYRCDDVYLLDNTPIHGEYTVTFPEGTGDYRIYACKVLLCDDGCDLTDVLSRAVWGYAPSYRIDRYDEIEAGDGWNYSGRQYYNIVPDEMAAELRRQMTEGGAEEYQISEQLGERRYIWLLDLGENRYLYTVLEAANYRKEMPENEIDLVNDIMKSAGVEVEEYDPDAVFKKQLAEFDAESLWSYPVGDHALWYRMLPGGSYMLYGQSGRKFYDLGVIPPEMLRHGMPETMETVLPIYANKTETGYEVCLSYTMRPYYFIVKLDEENGALTRTGIEDMEEDNVVKNPSYEEVTVIVDSLAELSEYHARHIISDNLFAFYSELIGNTSPIPEFNAVKISDFEIRFTVPVQDMTTYFTFTVESSGLDTLPPGKYYREVMEALEIVLIDPEEVNEDPFGDVEEVKKLRTFISGTYIWNTPIYGEGLSYPGIHNYICRYHGDSGSLPYEDYKRIAADEFGVTNFYELGTMGFVLEDGTIYEGGIGGSWNGDVVDVLTERNTTTVVMQFYADVNSLLKSYKVGYKFGREGKWLGYEILENSDYKPFGLHFSADKASGKTDPQVERFLPYYDAAHSVMTWFSGHGSFGATAEDLRKFFGYDYIDVSNYNVFVSNGITDPESMREYLGSIFTEKMTEELMAKCAAESYVPEEGERNLPVFLFRDGKVYIIAAAGSSRLYAEPEFSMNKVTEEEAILASRVYRIRYDALLGDYVTSDIGDLYFFRFRKAGDTWLCDEFPVFW